MDGMSLGSLDSLGSIRTVYLVLRMKGSIDIVMMLWLDSLMERYLDVTRERRLALMKIVDYFIVSIMVKLLHRGMLGIKDKETDG